jgi:hypothetical protein
MPMHRRKHNIKKKYLKPSNFLSARAPLAVYLRKELRHEEHGLSVRANTNPTDRYTAQLLQLQHVSLSVGRKRLEGSALADVFSPAWHFHVYRFNFLELFEGSRHVTVWQNAVTC